MTAALSAPQRYCSDCGTPIGYSGKTGKCNPCSKYTLYLNRHGNLIARTIDVPRVWCDQCDRRVSVDAGNACEAPFCKGKSE